MQSHEKEKKTVVLVQEQKNTPLEKDQSSKAD